MGKFSDVQDVLIADQANANAHREAQYRRDLSAHEALVAIHKRKALIDRAVRDMWPEDADFRIMPRAGVSWNGGFKIRDWASLVSARFVEISALNLHPNSVAIPYPPHRVPHVSHTAPHHDAYRTSPVRMVSDSIDIPRPPSRP